jgi:hypothetical protein
MEVYSMKIFSLVLVTMISLTILSSAVQDKVTTGPYSISFDLGLPKDAYKVEIADPKNAETASGNVQTQYSLEIVNRTGINRMATISIAKAPQILLTLDEMATNARLNMQNFGFSDIEAAALKIDGKNGSICMGYYFINKAKNEVYLVNYYPDQNTSASIMSSYPWNEGTLSILKTIHIETINATET